MMRLTQALALAVALAAVPLSAATVDEAAARRLMLGCEAEWAASSVSNDTSRVAPCLADDYAGVGSRGGVRSRAEVLAPEPGGSDFVSNKVDYVNIRFFGTTAIAQGSESWVRRGGGRGRFVWHDVWLRRGGRWQIVASQDTAAPPLDSK